MKKPVTLVLSMLLTFATVATVANHNIKTLHAAPYDNEDDSDDTKEGKADGNYFGYIDGYNRGLENYKKGDFTTRYTKTYKDDLAVYTTNDKFKENTNDYTTGYSVGYLYGYKEGYNLGIEGSKLTYEELLQIATSEDNLTGSPGERSGTALGSSAGSDQALIDYIAGSTKQANVSLSKFESTKSLTSRYFLTGESTTFMNDFLNTFRTSYVDAYEGRYQSLMDDFTEQNNKYGRVYNPGVDYDFNLHPEGSNLGLNFSFPAGSMYGEGFIGASKGRTPVSYDTKRLKFVDTDFVINAFSKSNFTHADYIDFYSPFTMSVEYYGSDDVGIYEFKNGAWQYLKTDIAEGKVSHTFPKGNYYGGRYCLFIEPSYKKFTDTNFSPFSDEIYTYGRRGVIYAPGTKLYPTTTISRAEVSYMLNGLLNPTDKAYSSKTAFKDAYAFGPYANSINFVNNKGYLNGVSSDTFGIGGKVTYNQMKIIIERATGQTFNMNEVFNSMVNDKFHRSKGLSNMNNYVTREEAVYILYYAFK